MRKILSPLFYLALLSCASFNISKAQTVRLASYSKDGSYENLYFNLQTKVWQYSSLQSPTLVTLQMVDEAQGKSGPVLKVKFPNEPDAVYTLAIMPIQGYHLECTSPSGVTQLFSQESKYISKNEQGIEEYIFASGPPPAYKYASSQNPRPIDLSIVGGDMMQGYMDVAFPGQSERYRLTSSPNGDLITSMDEQGKVQMFLREEY